MRKFLILVLLSQLIFFQKQLLADEGMWLPLLIERLNYVDMQKMGLKLTPEELYSINHSSLKDRIVGLSTSGATGNMFCTALVVSNNGLLFTNHHCGYNTIANHSSPEHDYITNGYWAKTYADELPNESLCASFLVRIENVTDKIIDVIKNEKDENARAAKVRSISIDIRKQAEENGKYEATVKSFFMGNEYYLFVFETYRDVRLVGAPPSSIGKFGGQTDNWMWPRYTGDFAVLRIYSSPDGSPGQYSAGNVPLKPPSFFPISLDGYSAGDFVMVWGYPGITNRYITSYGLEYNMNITIPTQVKILGKKMEVMKARMDGSDAVRLLYTSDYENIANAYKNYSGQAIMLRKNEIGQKKKATEDNFLSWYSEDPSRKLKYAAVLDKLRSGYNSMKSISIPLYYINHCMYSIDVCLLANKFSQLTDVLEKDDKNKESRILETLRKDVAEYYQKYDALLEKRLTVELLKLCAESVPASELPDIFSQIADRFNNDFTRYTSYLYENSLFGSQEAALKYLSKPGLKTLTKDPGWQLKESLSAAISKYSVALRELRLGVDASNRLFIEGLREMNPNKKFYPDANSSIRMTYGKVADYTNRDGNNYEYYSTLSGMMQKEIPGNAEFNIPARLKELFASKDFGKYYPPYSKDINVCFLTDTDITGGNSGSPVVNANGHLIGIAFDGNWETMGSDYMFEPSMQRTINVDIRYILFVMDRFAGATNLVNELNIVSGKSSSTAAPISSKSSIPAAGSAGISSAAIPKKKPQLPANLVIENIKLVDANNNNVIDATESNYLSVYLSNKGEGMASKVKLNFRESNKVQGLSFPATLDVGDLAPNQSREVKVPIQSTINLIQGEANFIVQFTEQNGFDSDPVRIDVKTNKFDFPDLVVVDYRFFSENGEEIRLGGRSKLELLLQNTGQGKASDVKVSFCNPGNVFPINDTVFGFPEIKPNSTQKVTYEFFTNKRYSLPTIPISVILSSELNPNGETKTFTAYLNRSVTDPQMISLNPTEQTKKIIITEASLTPPVDKNIPKVIVKYPKRFALIIGNEDYATFQRSISSEVNVLYAVNDATVFRKYVIDVLGVEEKNVFFETNATAGIMYQKIDQVCKLLERVGPEGELIFFYAGHGQPDENTKVPYLMPVDVSASNLPSAIKLSELYTRLGATGAKRVTIFLDACFSGGGRQTGLLAARSVKVKPAENEVSGNVVVFSASSGEQSALPFNENSHGLFTYFLLKKLQESQGKVNYRDLSGYLKEQISIESIRSNGKVQDPQVITSPEVQNSWGNWTFQ